MFQKNFEFIDGQDKSSRKKTRVHVTREHYRERRWQQTNALKAEKTEQRAVEEPLKAEFVISVTNFSQSRDDSSTIGAGLSRPGSQAAEVRLQRYHHPGTSMTFSGRHTSRPSPLTPLSAARSDPFQTFPITATPQVHRLVDHYHVVMPSLLHTHWGRRITHPFPIVDIFNLCRQDAASFLVMLHHAAHHLAKTHGHDEDTPQIIEYKYKTLRLLNERIAASSGPFDDGIVASVGLLANAERVWGDKEVSRMHWNALKQMIATRGGFPAFRHNHLLHTKLVWTFIALAGVSPSGNPAYTNAFAQMDAEQSERSGKIPRSVFDESCVEFVKFFISRQADALRSLPTSPAHRKFQELKFPVRTKCFRPGTRMYAALAPVSSGYSRPEKRRAVDNGRMACLVYLNVVIAEYGNFSDQTEQFFEIFSGFVQDDDHDCALSAEHLLWSLVRGIETKRAEERIWMVSRMIGVIKRADQKTWSDIEDALRLFLTMPDDTSDLVAYLTAWDSERFRKEMMAFCENDIARSYMLTVGDTQRTPTFDSCPNETDFLPETRDVQWFPQTEAAAAGGVPPHPRLTEALERLSMSPRPQEASTCSLEFSP